jgi:hypothetical protein
MAGIIGFSCTLYWIQQGGPVRRYRRILASRPEAYLGDEGFYANGEYTPWAMYGNYLLGATVDDAPSAHLLLKYQVYSRYDSGIRYKRIPIPEGHSTDVPFILQKLAIRFRRPLLSKTPREMQHNARVSPASAGRSTLRQPMMGFYLCEQRTPLRGALRRSASPPSFPQFANS